VRTSVDVHNYLTEHEAQHEVFTAGGRFRSPERIAAVLDLPPALVGKVLLYESPDAVVAAVVPIGFVADIQVLREASGVPSLEPVANGRASELSGFLPEAIPPAGMPSEIAVVVDRSLDRDEVLYFPAGEVHAVLKIRGTELVRATRALVAPIAALARPVGRRRAWKKR
jgi:prolyl-tRNA editing enzyme YbaK/EbsC (Cys-tRNA(Pro) deacylase)